MGTENPLFRIFFSFCGLIKDHLWIIRGIRKVIVFSENIGIYLG